MPGLFGDYPMTREASGTSWQPDAAPHAGLHLARGGWDLMAHGFVDLVWTDQDGPRGDDELFVANMLMGTARRPWAGGTLGLRGMVSLEPASVGEEGYPLLLQVGETADGHTPLVDRQHPHDAFMELAASWSRAWGEDRSAFLYLGWPGEPALGPPAFMHRFSGQEMPEAPLGHHWLDSTHITFGVATLGLVAGGWKLEGSLFTGREPDEERWDLEEPRWDSWSARLSWNPTPEWALQASRGRLESPEQLAPEVDVERTTLSASWSFGGGERPAQATLAWGRNEPRPGRSTDTLLLEATAVVAGRHAVMGRAERGERDELFGHPHAEENEPAPAAAVDELVGRVFDVAKLSLGYRYDLAARGPLGLGVGALGSVYALPRELEAVYGDGLFSVTVFARARLR